MSDSEKSSKRQKTGEKSYEERVKAVGPIATPLASKKQTKKLHKLVKKAAKSKSVRRGVKEVVKSLRKGNQGLCIIAGDISPVDVIAHLPVLCEEKDVPYMYVPSKADLGTASATKRPTSCILVVPSSKLDAKDLYDEMKKEAEAAAPQF